MASIIRNNERIQLSDEEVRSIIAEEHEKDIRYEVEQALSVYEEDDVISFASYDRSLFDSEADARADFIEAVTEHIIDMEDTDERTPPSHRFRANFDSEVYDTAELLDYLKGE